MPIQPPTAEERRKLLEMGISQADIDREFGPEPKSSAPSRPTLESLRAPAEATGPRLTPQQLEERGQYFAPEMAHALNVISGLPGVERGFMKGEFKKAQKQTGGFASALERSVVPAAAVAAMAPAAALSVFGPATAAEFVPAMLARTGIMSGYGALKGGLEAESLSDVPLEATKGAVIHGAGQLVGEGALPVAGTVMRALGRIPVVGTAGKAAIKAVAEEVGPAWEKYIQQPVSEALGRKAANIAPESALVGWKDVLSGASQFVAPRNAQMVSRIAEAGLPGSPGTRGLTPEFMEERARLAAQAAEEFAPTVKAAKEATAGIRTRTAGIQETVTERAKASAQAKEQATIDALHTRAQEIAGKLATPEQQANAYRQAIVEAQSKAGEEGYSLIQGMKPLTQTPKRTYQRIREDADLLKEYEAATEQQRSRLLNERLNVEGGSPFERVPEVRLPKEKIGVKQINPATGEVDEVSMTQATPETFDLMRRGVSERIGRADETGISASRGKALHSKIDKMEEEYISQFSPEDQAIYRGVRAEQRAHFEMLDGLNAGLALSKLSPSATPTVKTAGEYNIDDVIKRLTSPQDKGGYSDAYKSGFQVGARNAVANLIREASDVGPGAASTALEALVASSVARQRSELVLGKDLIAQIQDVIPSAVKKAGEKAALSVTARGEVRGARVGAIGERMATKSEEEAKQLAEMLAAKKNRADRLQEGAQMGQALKQAMFGSDVNAPAAFLQTVQPRLGGGANVPLSNLGGSMIQREIAGLSPAEAIAKLEGYAKNPATRSILGADLDATIAQLKQAIKPRLGPVKPYGVMAGTIGARDLLAPRSTP